MITSKNDFIKMFTLHGDDTKMKGLRSLSTSPLENYLCKARHTNARFICNKCYSFTYNKMRKQLREKLSRNTAELTGAVIPFEYIPYLNDRYFRNESFGDLQNVTQAINYLNLIRKNPETLFGWWTKNPGFIKTALKVLGIEKPSNVQIVFSSCCINERINIETVKKAFPFIDKVFTVYDAEYIKKNDVRINCGSKKCIDCLNCYKPGGNAEVSEKLK